MKNQTGSLRAYAIVIVIAGAFLLLGTCLFFFISYVNFTAKLELSVYGEELAATITEKNKDDEDYYLHYKYSVQNKEYNYSDWERVHPLGAEIDIRRPKAKKVWDGLSVADTIDIVYSTKNPERSYLRDYPMYSYWESLFFFLFGLLGLCVSLLFLSVALVALFRKEGSLSKELYDGLSKNTPRFLSAYDVKPVPLKKFEQQDQEGWGILRSATCKCGNTDFKIYGSINKVKKWFFINAFQGLPPVTTECISCGDKQLLFDPNQHGWDAEHGYPYPSEYIGKDGTRLAFEHHKEIIVNLMYHANLPAERWIDLVKEKNLDSIIDYFDQFSIVFYGDDDVLYRDFDSNLTLGEFEEEKRLKQEAKKQSKSA